MRRNLEFKARVKDPSSLERLFSRSTIYKILYAGCRKAAKQNGAVFGEVLIQTDTYFCVQNGRLKLRETVGQKPELIYYERDESSTASMQSNYTVLQLSEPSLKDLLAKSLGVKAIVEKERRLLKLKNARIHLDQVKGLGQFLEFEVVSEGDDTGDAKLLEKLKGLAGPFVAEEINSSYSDLMLSSNFGRST